MLLTVADGGVQNVALAGPEG